MSASDSYILGRVKVVDHGADSDRYNIAILGDGYRLVEQGINRRHGKYRP